MFAKRLVFSAIAVLLSFYVAGCGGSARPISVAITPSATTVDGVTGNTVTLSATVGNDKAGAGVSWAVSGGGTISGNTSSATYTPPAAGASAVTATITAASVVDSTKTASVQITVPAKAAISTASMTAGAVGTAFNASLAATGGITPYTWTITSGTLPTGLAMSTGGAITGTPMAAGAGTASITFKVTDSGKPNPLTATATMNVTVAAAPPISFGSATVADGTMTVAYAGAITATGGAGPLTYAIHLGAFPDGVTMATTGVLSGTPSKVGTFSVTVRASDAFGDSATQAYTVKIGYPALHVTALTPPTGYVGSNYVQTTLAATGGSGTGYTWAISSGSAMPDGLTLLAGGVISGRPTAAGSSTTSVTVTDSASNTATASLSFVIKAGISVLTLPTLPVAYSGSNYSQQLTASGGSGSGYTWSAGSGAAVRAHIPALSGLPPGINLSASGLLSGKPTSTGVWNFTLTVTDDANNSASLDGTMTVSAGITIGSITLPKGYQGTAYPGATFTATGGSESGYSWTWAAASGSSLPAGLTLSTGGAVSGTPTGSGSFSVVVTVTDSASNTASQTLSLVIEATLTISTTSPLKSGTINTAYSTTLAATGGSGTYTSWTVTQGADQLTPLNLSLSNGGVLSGTPTTAGAATFTAQVTDSESHTATASLTVTVYSALTITTTTLPYGMVGTAYSQTLTAGGGTGTGYTWTALNSNLSTYGLALSAEGVVSGNPTTAGTASFTPKVTDSANTSATAGSPITITIYATLNLPNTNPQSLPSTGTTGVAYSGTVAATGGSGTYQWTITGMPSDGLSASTSGGTLTVSGTPSAPATVTFTAAVKDTVTNATVGPFTYSITISNPTPLTFTTGGTLPAGTVNQAYSQTIVGNGGVGPYTWTIKGANLPSNGTPQPLANGLTVASTGTLTLNIGGTPTVTGTVSFTATITDSLNASIGPATFTIQVNSAGSMVSGHVAVVSQCGSSRVPDVEFTINTTPPQTVMPDDSATYTFNNVPNGSYTITPSMSGASTVFTPATMNVTVNNADLTDKNFLVQVGYTISGTITYAGSNTGPINLSLINNNCGGNGLPGTSISTPGEFSIRGVPPGVYTVVAWMDTQGKGHPNTSDPQGTKGFNVTAGSVTNAAITLADPTPSLPGTGPKIDLVMPSDKGVIISYGGITDANGIEAVTAYEVQWSTSSSFSSPSTHTFPANGTKGASIWILNSSTSGVTASSLTNGTAYYFRARGVLGAGRTGWTTWGSPTAVTLGQPSGTGYNTITGAMTIPSGMTITGPLYVGFYSNTKGIFATRIAAPSSGSANAFTVYVPTGNNYFYFGILDQNNNGIVDVGDLSNTDDGGSGSTVNISGNMTGQNKTLPFRNSAASVYTRFNNQVNSGGTSSSYTITVNVSESAKLPVSAVLTAGPNLLHPVDLGVCADCGKAQLQYVAYLGELTQGGPVPAVNDTYSLTVTYSDGTTETFTPNITGVLGAAQLPTNMLPSVTAGSRQPTFTWTYPANPANYSYEFGVWAQNGGDLWYIPGSGSAGNGFNYSDIPGGSIIWGVDPTDPNNTPTGSLSSGATYNWWITVSDSNLNSAQAQTYFVAP